MHLLLGLAHAVPLDLPATEDPAVWADTASLAGFELGPAGGATWARIEPSTGEWVLLVQDTSGAIRTVSVPPPTTSAQREDLVFLASSLLEPLDAPAPETRKPRPPAPPEPDPEPVVAAAPVEVEVETAPVTPSIRLHARLDAGIAGAHSESLRPLVGVRVGAELEPVTLGAEAAVRPWSTMRDYDVTVHAASLGGFFDVPVASAHVGAGAGVAWQLYRAGDARMSGLVPVITARAGWDRGRLGVFARLDADLRRVEVVTDTTERLSPLTVSAGVSIRR